MKISRRRSAMVALVAAVGLVAACGSDLDGATEDESAAAESDEETGDSDDEVESDPRADWPEVIYHGVQPSDDAERLAESYAPFETYMGECLEHPFEAIMGTNYTAMIEAMRTGQLHTSFMGPFAYILGVERAGAEAMVQLVAEPDDAFYRSVIIALDDSGFTGLDDLEGATFAFTDPASTSGYMFPRAMMLGELGVEDDSLDDWFGEVVYSGGHANSVLSVLNGDVQAAAVASNNSLFTVGLDPSHPREDDVVIVADTLDIPISTKAIQRDLPADLKAEVKSCLLAMGEPDVLAQYDGLADLLALRTGGDPGLVIEVDDSAYDVVRETAELLNLSPEQLLG